MFAHATQLSATKSVKCTRMGAAHCRPVRCIASRGSARPLLNVAQPANNPVPNFYIPNRVRGTKYAICAASYNEFMPAVVATPGVKFAVVVARFNDLVTKLLLQGSVEAFKRHGVAPDNVDVVWVPGSFELPVVAKSMAASGQYAGVVCIGAIVKGATDHYDAVVGGTTSGLMTAGVTTGVPVIFGVLTCDTMDQALDRAGGKVGNKGAEAAITAVEMANLMHTLREQGKAAAANS